MTLTQFQKLLQGICDKKVGDRAITATTSLLGRDGVLTVGLETRTDPPKTIFIMSDLSVLDIDVALATKKEALALPCVKAISKALGGWLAGK